MQVGIPQGRAMQSTSYSKKQLVELRELGGTLII
jgi:hypothetical protein